MSTEVDIRGHRYPADYGWCVVCGVEAGAVCVVVSERPLEDDDGLQPGDPRPDAHFYRGVRSGDSGRRARVPVKDEPPYYLGLRRP